MFSPDGRLLASAQDNGTVRLWVAATGKTVGGPLAVGAGTGDFVSKVAFSRNGEFLATVGIRTGGTPRNRAKGNR